MVSSKSSSKPYQVLLSDLDGVIRHFPKRRDHELETNFGLPQGTITGIAFEPDLLGRVVTGKISDAEWRTEIRSALVSRRGEILGAKIETHWSEFPGELDPQVWDFLQECRTESKIALLTHATSRLRADLTRLGIWDKVDQIFNTSEIGFAKPDPRVFAHAIQSLGCEPSAILFTDDSEKNVNAARVAGLSALHFKSLDELREIWKKGILN